MFMRLTVTGHGIKWQGPKHEAALHARWISSARYTSGQQLAVVDQLRMKNNQTPLENPRSENLDDEPLVRLLVAEAARRGDTLVMLAENLGVSYSRLTQWRRKEASMATAHRSVHVNAAAYLGLPSALALVLAGVVTLPDFIWPSPDSLNSRIQKEIEAMRQDPLLGGFVPQELTSTSREIRMFVAFLYAETGRRSSARQGGQHWLSLLHGAAASHDELLRMAESKEARSVASQGLF